MKNKERKSSAFLYLFSFIMIYMIFVIGQDIINDKTKQNEDKYQYSDNVFSIITTPENKVLEGKIEQYFDKVGEKVIINYADNLEIVDILNSGEKYDAVWSSNSIWLNMLDSSKVRTSNLKSTSITPIVFGIKKSKAQELGLIGKDVTMNDLLNLIESGKLTFSMANPITTNSGASAYLNILSTLAGNPEVLTKDHLKDATLRSKVKAFFKGLKRTSGDEAFLETSFVNGDYDAAISYESSIISINKKLVASDKEPLYVIYPVDGVSICDSPLVYINNGNDDKKEQFLDFQSYILSDEGQGLLASLGRRTWYGGVTDKADKSIFNPSWGIDTTKYVSPVKYPSKDVIREALILYQTELRKPVHVVFCLDYSGSMRGEGIKSLRDALNYIFGSGAISNLIQFSHNDIVDILIFNDTVKHVASEYGDNSEALLYYPMNTSPYGGTSLFPSAEEAYEILANESDEYNTSIILMTDGEGNIGHEDTIRRIYKDNKKSIPIYSITFGQADEEQLSFLASISNGKVFDGKTDLVKAFKEVRGYN